MGQQTPSNGALKSNPESKPGLEAHEELNEN